MALPFVGVPDHAEAATIELDLAASALRTGDAEAAEESVANAREHVDEAMGTIDGLSGDIWSLIPVAGTPVADARGLVRVLDHATSIAEIGIDLYPRVSGDGATLLRGEQVDEATLDAMLAGARRIGEHLREAERELAGISGSSPVVGEVIAAKRDEARAAVAPLADAFDDVEPLLDEIKPMLGFEGRRSYLIALLNPSELRFSGGAALVFAPLALDEGALEVEEPHTVRGDLKLQLMDLWEGVEGNDFHRDNTRVMNSTFAPSWSVSGEELLRAWEVNQEERHDGVIALDVVAIASLVGTAGGIDVPGYGQITQDNLVETLVGSYDDFYPDADSQDGLNARLIPAFKDAMFNGGDYVEKVRTLAGAADGRHFALYLRDPEVQQGVADLGLEGDLTEPEGDYVGLFTQNLNGSKVDYWQRRRITLDVRLTRRGSARNRLEARIHNDTPPFPFPIPDPRIGYFTRHAKLTVGAFLPKDVKVSDATAAGRRWRPEVRDFYDHSYVRRRLPLKPTEEKSLTLEYRVQHASRESTSGGFVYHLAVDPQGTVNPDRFRVSVKLPRGHRAAALPEGWREKGRRLRFSTNLESTMIWAIPVDRVR